MKQQRLNLDLSQPQVMAILNVTPDSFYSGSRTYERAEIEARVARIIAEGASIIDIGGYSSRPNAEDITVEEEWRRVELGLSVVRSLNNDIMISIDTFRAEVAERAIEKFGSLIINDISAGEIDVRLMSVAAKYGVPYIAMHMKGTPQTMQSLTEYSDVVSEVFDYFVTKIAQLRRLGVEDVIIDPGFGFAKNVEQNYALMRDMHRLSDLGCPILVGISRKSMIYKPLNSSTEEALTGTIALNWESLRQGASILRVHDVAQAVEVVKLHSLIK